MGRPTDLTPELQVAICAELRAGVSIETAATLCGIGSSTLKDWRARGKSGEPRYVDFSSATDAARAQAKAKAIKAVRAGLLPGKDAAPDWKAEAWFLERTFPAEYAPQQSVNVKVEQQLDAALDRLQGKLAPDVYAAVLAAIAVDDAPPEGTDEG